MIKRFYNSLAPLVICYAGAVFVTHNPQHTTWVTAGLTVMVVVGVWYRLKEMSNTAP